MSGVAIVGQGYMAATHAAAWMRLGYDIRYIVAPGDRNADGFAPAALFTNELADALRDPSVDRVSVCTPTPTHASIAIRALRAGKHVLLEKPIALTIEDAQAIEAAAEESRRTFMVAQVVRFFAGYEELLRRVRSDEIGEIQSVRALRALARPTWAPWWDDATQSGGVPVDFAIHDYDQANLFIGEPARVRASQPRAEGPIEATIEYANGAVAQILSYPYLPAGAPFTASLKVIGSRGHTEYRLTSGAPTESSTGTESTMTTSTDAGVSVENIDGGDPYLKEINYFNQCISGHQPPERSSTSSAVAALKVSLAVVAALETDTWVSV